MTSNLQALLFFRQRAAAAQGALLALVWFCNALKCEKISEMCQMRVEAGGKWCRPAAVGEREIGISRDPSDPILRLLIHLIGEGGVVIDPGISPALLTHPLHH